MNSKRKLILIQKGESIEYRAMRSFHHVRRSIATQRLQEPKAVQKPSSFSPVTPVTPVAIFSKI